MLLLSLQLLLTGIGAGLLAGLLGIGGGLVTVPALTWILLNNGTPIDQAVAMAVATSLGAMLLTSASAIWFHDRRGGVDWTCVARLAPAVGLGALAGAWLATELSGPALARVFAVAAAIIGLRMILAKQSTRYATERAAFPRGWYVAGPLIGALSSMIGIGGGSFNVPYLAHNGYAMVRAVAIASACGWPIAAGGVVGFVVLGWHEDFRPWSLGYLYGPGCLLIGLAGASAAPFGVALAHRLPARGLRRLFGIALVGVAVRMAW